MAKRKRASMREGPLADLFRATDRPADAEEAAAPEPPAAPPEPAATPEPPAHRPSSEPVTAELAGTESSEVSVYRVGDERFGYEPTPSPAIDRPEPEHRERSLGNLLAEEPREERPAYGRDEPTPSATSDYGPVASHTPVIRVIGVGGAGVNAINRMVDAGVHGVEFMAVNTDLQSLQASTADLTVHIGGSVTRGLGSGSDPKLGYRAAFEEQDRIKRLLKGSDMVFVAAGAGGGTGTGAAPVIARLARDVGALTVGIITKPFRFEGTKRNQQAAEGVEALAAEVDTLITVPNEKLLSVLSSNTSMVDAFRVADDVLRQGVQGISDLITLPSIINLDFADVRTTMRDAGPALLGIGMGTGDNRAQFAAERAISSPLLETSMEGARSILLSIIGGEDLSLVEVSEAADAVREAAHPEANIIFGANVDPSLGDQLWVTVVATRFDGRGRRSDGKPTTRESRKVVRPSARRPAEGSRSGGGSGRPDSPARDLSIDVPEFDVR